jgi:hypothetical protein
MSPAYVGALRGDLLDAIRTTFFEPLDGLLRDASASGEFMIDDVELTARAVITLIFAESTALQMIASPAPAKNQSDNAVFLAQLLTKGLLPRLA